MRFAFTEEQLAFRDAVRDLLARECPPSVVRDAWTNTSGRTQGLWGHLGEMGVVGALGYGFVNAPDGGDHLQIQASTDDVSVAGYDVYKDGVKIDTVTGTSKTVTGLSQSTAYKFKVQAKDSIGQTSAFSTEITVTTTDNTIVKYAYTLKGTSVLKTLTTGPVPLTGGISADLTLATGDFTGDLVLNSTKANLKVLGTLPVKADIGFEQNPADFPYALADRVFREHPAAGKALEGRGEPGRQLVEHKPFKINGLRAGLNSRGDRRGGDRREGRR